MNRTFFGAALLGASLALANAAIAQNFPSKPVDYVIPFGPGGESDISARMQQSFFKQKFGQELVVSYKPGGGGAVGWSQLNKMGADGHSIMGINLPHIVMQPLGKNVGYKTEDLTPIYWFHYTPDALIVPADSEFKTVADFIAFAKANPGKITLSGSGKASANHLAQVSFDELADIKTTYVAFKGTGESVAALLGKQVTGSWGYTTIGSAQGNKVRLLAVAMEERHPAFPDVPTFRESGFDLVGGAFRGIAVPSSTPEPLRQQWSDMIGGINADPKFRQQMLDGGFALLDISYDKMPAFMAERQKRYVEAAKNAGLAP